LRHYAYSLKCLTSSESESLSLETSLAARLAFGLVERCNHERSSVGIDEANAAGLLVQRVLRQDTVPEIHSPDGGQLSFLIDTWVYRRILAQFTSQLGRLNSADFGYTQTSVSLLSPLFPPCLQQLLYLFSRGWSLHVRLLLKKNRTGPAMMDDDE